METSFGSWVKRRRKSLDFTQAELAHRVGCSPSAIFKIEADERRTSRQVAELLAAHLQIPQDQHELFLKIARQEKGIATLESIPSLSPTVGAPKLLPRRSSLPVFPTHFIGREHEIAFVSNQLLDPACRLLTLTGPGGVGKTRLAIEVARQLEPDFADGVCFLSLAPLDRVESILPLLAEETGSSLSGPAGPKLQVMNILREKEILLVLDNMEHLVAGSSLLGEILQQAPRVKLLLTTREPVHLQWEWIFEVQGFPVPDAVDAQALETNSALKLFINKARQVTPAFALNPASRAALLRICRAVDGLPLAIELAAAWVRVMSVAEIAQELENNFDLLETSLQDVPARHRSIRSTFDYSWKLLSADEGTVLTKLSVFTGSFNRKAAGVIAGATTSLLSSLVSKSLLRFNQPAARYEFHELIHQYVLARLQQQPDLEKATREMHSRYFSGWLAGQEADLKSTQQAQTAAQIRLESTNWLAAWQWAVRHHHLDFIRPMIPTFYWFYEVHGDNAGPLSTIEWTMSTLRAAGAPENLVTPAEKTTFAFLLDQLGWFRFRTGAVDQVADLYAEGLRLAEASQDTEVLYYIYANWCYLALLRGDFVEAEQLALKSLENAQALQSPWHIAIPTNVRGIVAFQRGNLDEAYRMLSSCLNLWRSVGDPGGIVFCLLYLGSTALALGKIEAAEEILSECDAMARDKHDRWAQAVSLDLLGKVSMQKGQPQIAFELFQKSLTLSREIANQWGSTQTLIHLGDARAALAQADEARRLIQEAYRNAQQARWVPTVLEALVAFLSIDCNHPAPEKLALTLAVLAHPAVTPPTRQRAEQLRDRLIPMMDSTQVGLAQSQAAQLNPELSAQTLLRQDGPFS